SAVGGPYTAIPTQTAATGHANNITATNWFNAVVSCSANTNYSVLSTPVEVDVIQSVVYAPVPFVENFDATWGNRCDLRNVPNSTYWTSLPTTGNNSWRRQDDGGAANWTNAGSNIVTAYAGGGAANFHSKSATAGSTGAL